MLRDGVDGVSINTNENVISMLIGSVDRTSMGMYTCRANNTVGVDQQSHSVTILSKSVIAILLYTVILLEKVFTKS